MKITEMNLHVNKIDDEAMETLGLFIQSNTSLECIDIGSNKISDKGMKILDKYMDERAVIKEIKLWGNEKITDASIPLLMRWIEVTQIQIIDITKTSITNQNILKGPLDVKRALVSASEHGWIGQE